MSNSKTTSISLPVLVFMVFLVLKLAEIGTVATWSWWWVCAPLWIPASIGILAFLILIVLHLIFD